jgi:fatty acid desaturase
VKEAGILQKTTPFYAFLITFSFAGYGLSVAAIVHLDGVLTLSAACLSFTLFTVQLAGLMHDSGHRAVFKSTKRNNVLGYVSCALIGMVFESWRERHNAHHAHPNQENKDPDLEIPFIATTREQFLKKPVVQRFFLSHQAYYYYPLSTIIAFSNRLGSITYFWRHRSREVVWQFAIYVAGIVFLFVMPFLVFPLEKAVFVFLFVHLSSGAYLGMCFAPNHKGMESISRTQTLPFIEQQVITARNISGGFVTELFMVGLNHQIEHHLFPSCPRNKLKLLKPYVSLASKALELNYAEVGFVQTNRMLVGN